ncbi:MAG: hypothetical protein LUE10_04350 [Alistipes sp.]|nr:hypothetical protein [Alistipes sp.]
MKIKTILLLVSAFALFACSDDDCKGNPEEEAHTAWIEFTVTDADGNDLLEDYGDGSFVFGVSVRFANRVYMYEGEIVDYSGIRYRIYNKEDGNNILAFGPLNSDDNLRKEKIVVDWGDGSEPDEFQVDLYTSSVNCQVERHTAFYADGHKVELPIRKVIE